MKCVNCDERMEDDTEVCPRCLKSNVDISLDVGPTSHLPGTVGKIEVMKDRASKRIRIFHPEDAKDTISSELLPTRLHNELGARVILKERRDDLYELERSANQSNRVRSVVDSTGTNLQPGAGEAAEDQGTI